MVMCDNPLGNIEPKFPFAYNYVSIIIVIVLVLLNSNFFYKIVCCYVVPSPVILFVINIPDL